MGATQSSGAKQRVLYGDKASINSFNRGDYQLNTSGAQSDDSGTVKWNDSYYVDPSSVRGNQACDRAGHAGYIGSAIKTNSEDTCADRCSQNGDCIGFSFSKSKQDCQLQNKRVLQSPVKCDNGYSFILREQITPFSSVQTISATNAVATNAVATNAPSGMKASSKGSSILPGESMLVTCAASLAEGEQPMRRVNRPRVPFDKIDDWVKENRPYDAHYPCGSGDKYTVNDPMEIFQYLQALEGKFELEKMTEAQVEKELKKIKSMYTDSGKKKLNALRKECDAKTGRAQTSTGARLVEAERAQTSTGARLSEKGEGETAVRKVAERVATKEGYRIAPYNINYNSRSIRGMQI